MAAELRAEVAALRMRVQVWNPSSSCDLCLLYLRLIVRGCFFFHLVLETWGCMWPGVGEGEPEAGQHCFKLHLRIQGDAFTFFLSAAKICLRGFRAVCSLSLSNMRELPKLIACSFAILYHANVLEDNILCEVSVLFAIAVPSIVLLSGK